MKTIYDAILKAKQEQHKLLAILIDPDKLTVAEIEPLAKRINESDANFVFIGGSKVQANYTDTVVTELRRFTKLPLVIFPGHPSQISQNANAILFLSLISGRNPEYLIGKHIEAVPQLLQSHLEIIPTGYILIENKSSTSVERVSKTKPIPRKAIETIKNTAKAGELLGMKLIYLEAGSGALQPVDAKIIKSVKTHLHIPLIVGGGLKTKLDIEKAYKAGADLVVIGTAFERNPNFFETLKTSNDTTSLIYKLEQ